MLVESGLVEASLKHIRLFNAETHTKANLVTNESIQRYLNVILFDWQICCLECSWERCLVGDCLEGILTVNGAYNKESNELRLFFSNCQLPFSNDLGVTSPLQLRWWVSSCKSISS